MPQYADSWSAKTDFVPDTPSQTLTTKESTNLNFTTIKTGSYSSLVGSKQGWEFALLLIRSFTLSLLALLLFALRSFALLLLLLFLKEWLDQNERITFITFSNTIVIHSFIKSDSLLMKEGFALFKRGLCSFLKRKLKTGLISRFLALQSMREDWLRTMCALL